jgi:hypothetical protein
MVEEIIEVLEGLLTSIPFWLFFGGIVVAMILGGISQLFRSWANRYNEASIFMGCASIFFTLLSVLALIYAAYVVATSSTNLLQSLVTIAIVFIILFIVAFAVVLVLFIPFQLFRWLYRATVDLLRGPSQW